MDAIFSILPIYAFILLGFVAKKIFTTRIHEKTLVLFSVYFFQPIIVFWGLTTKPLDLELATVPLIHFAILVLSVLFMYFASKLIFKDRKKQSIYLAVSVMGNSGNVGIPLCIALFGIESLPYTSVINISTIFFFYTFSAYFLARENFNLKDAIKSVTKIPAISVALFALCFNYMGIEVGSHVHKALEMGSYTSMVIQLVVFGIYLSDVKIKIIPWKLATHIILVKHILLPIIGIFFICYFTNLNPYSASILTMCIMVPLAVSNVNLSALYNCHPEDVAITVLISCVVFMLLSPIYIEIVNYFFRI